MRQPSLFVKCHPRVKDGKQHRYWSIGENRRTHDGHRLQRQVIYLSEINDRQKANWVKQIEVFDTAAQTDETLALFPEERLVPAEVGPAVQICLHRLEISRPRQWGACWLALGLWKLLKLDPFWSERLGPSREGTQWRLILQALSVYRLIDPSSEWRLHRQWFDATALSDWLGPDFQLGCKENLYRTLDKLLVKVSVPSFDNLVDRGTELDRGPVRSLTVPEQDGNLRGMASCASSKGQIVLPAKIRRQDREGVVLLNG